MGFAMPQFSRLQLLLRRRELIVDGIPVPLGSRAFEVLALLVEARGELVTKDEILCQVWPGSVVEENNLQVHISAIRKALGPDRGIIRTISGRGYRLVAEVSTDTQISFNAQPAPANGPSPTNLPNPVTDLIGRGAEVADVARLMSAQRIVTLVGPGGIGKTRLGLRAAFDLLPEFPDGVWLVELAALSHPNLVPDAVAAALRLGFAGGVASPTSVAQAIGPGRILVVLDNCEHVIEMAARMAEAMARSNPQLRVMATSREPRQSDGEWIYRVPPLALPPEDVGDGNGLLRHGAVHLFVERAQAVERRFTLDERSAAIVARVCRRLDGIPLAIELAAARIGTLGLEGLDDRLSDCFTLLTGGRRTALPRHQTLRATLDWSYDMLSAVEQAVLRRLAVFAGRFTLEAAGTVASEPGTSASRIIDHVASMAAKSLVTNDFHSRTTDHRLLETTRAYAAGKLAESGELDRISGRHAEYYRDLFARAQTDATAQPADQWLDTYGRQLDNVRAALDWAFSPTGDPTIGVALTISTLALWKHLSLMDECRQRVERALATIPCGSCPSARQEMELTSALGASLLYTTGPGPAMTAAWTRASVLAESLGDLDHRLRSLFGLWLGAIHRGDLGEALTLATRFHATAADAPDLADQLVGIRIMGSSLHYLGDQTNARKHIEDMLRRYVAPAGRSHIVRFNFDQPLAARDFLARILWLQGLPDQARHAAGGIVEDALANGHALTLCHGLVQAACPVALFTGDLATADRLVTMLLDRSARHGLSLWHAVGRCFEGMLVVQRGDRGAGVRLLRTAIDDLGETRFAAYQTAFLGVLAEGLIADGRPRQGLAVIEDALDRCERLQAHWCLAELLRIKGEAMLQGDAPDAVALAERHFLKAQDVARRQGALSFELRAAIGLAQLRDRQARPAEARAGLATVYARFTEGFETADLKAAAALL
jgi:predicted ATPase/DNA-binding winged helix-turn-helix (wHTH) protein